MGDVDDGDGDDDDGDSGVAAFAAAFDPPRMRMAAADAEVVAGMRRTN